MATYYVSSVDGDNADDGSTWSLAKATVAGALAVATTTGDVILVDSAHDFNPAAAISWNPSANVHVSIISVNRGTGAHEAGATEHTNDYSGSFNIMSGGSAGVGLYVEGMTLASSGGDGHFRLATQAENSSLELVNCRLEQRGAWTYIEMGARWDYYKPSRISAKGCTFAWYTYSDPTMLDISSCNAEFVGCTLEVASGSPGGTSLVSFPAIANHTGVSFIGCDLSAYTQSAPLISGAANLRGGAPVEFINCKLHANSVLAPIGTWPVHQSGSVAYVNCDSGDTTYKYAYYTREGALTVDTATYASSGAEVDANPLSWSIATTSGCTERTPFITPWVSTWIDSTGSKTLSLEFVYDSASNYDDREIWAQIEYLGNASYPLSTVYSSRNAEPFTGTGTDLTAGSATWTEALTNDNKDKITTTVTVNQKGLARARLFVAVASTTIYLDPQLRVA